MKQIQTYLFGPPKIENVTHYGKNVKIVWLLILLAQKKRLEALNATQKPELFAIQHFLKFRNNCYLLNFSKNTFFFTFCGCFLFFHKKVHCKQLWFFVLRSVYQYASFELYK